MDDELNFLRGLRNKVLFSQRQAIEPDDLIRVAIKLGKKELPLAKSTGFHVELSQYYMVVGTADKGDIEYLVNSLITPGKDEAEQKKSIVISVINSQYFKIVYKLPSGVTMYQPKRSLTLWVTPLVTD